MRLHWSSRTSFNGDWLAGDWATPNTEFRSPDEDLYSFMPCKIMRKLQYLQHSVGSNWLNIHQRTV